MKKNYKQKNKGFTLVEVLVATFIFTSIMMVSISSLLATMSASKKARALRVAMDNVNFAMESMTRSIRMGEYYNCDTSINNFQITEELSSGANCQDGQNALYFHPQKNLPEDGNIGYGFDENRSQLKRYDKDNMNGVSMISSEVKVDELRFFVNGEDEPSLQASVYIKMKGSVTVRGQETSFALQTVASKRGF